MLALCCRSPPPPPCHERRGKERRKGSGQLYPQIPPDTQHFYYNGHPDTFPPRSRYLDRLLVGVVTDTNSSTTFESQSWFFFQAFQCNEFILSSQSQQPLNWRKYFHNLATTNNFGCSSQLQRIEDRHTALLKARGPPRALGQCF